MSIPTRRSDAVPQIVKALGFTLETHELDLLNCTLAFAIRRWKKIALSLRKRVQDEPTPPTLGESSKKLANDFLCNIAYCHDVSSDQGALIGLIVLQFSSVFEELKFHTKDWSEIIGLITEFSLNWSFLIRLR